MEGGHRVMSSKTIDERVVEMEFNNSNFEKNVSTSISTLDKLKKALKLDGAANAFEKINKASDKIDFSTLSSGVQTVSLKFSALQTVAISALNRITNEAINTGTQLVKSLSVDQISAGWQKFAGKTTSVATLIAQGYSMDEVEKQLSQLNWFTDETSYEFTDMVSNISKFTAAGQDLEGSVTAMEGIALWAALSGQNASTASRAMYQLSQAMSAGVMRWEDYRSIQNANMNTVEFQQKCIDAAVAAGTLEETSDGVYKSLVATTKAGAKEFTATQFVGSLTEGLWLTSDVMMDVFNEYSGAVQEVYDYSRKYGVTASEAIEALGDSVDEFGLKALLAGQEAKTFEDVLNSVKDAVSTGWMNTFENIFGNYEEQRVLWTKLANEMYAVFAEGGNERNDMLKEWSDLGGRTELINAFWKAWDAGIDILDTVKEAFHDVFPKMTAKELLAITKNISKMTDKMKLSDEQSKFLKETFTSLFTVFKTVKTILVKVKEAFKEVFPASTTELLHGILTNVKKITDALQPSEQTLARIKSTVKGVFAAFSILWQVLKAVMTALAPIGRMFGLAGDGALSLSAGLGDAIVSLDEYLKTSDVLQTGAKKVADALIKVGEWAKKAAEWIKKAAIAIKNFFAPIVPYVKDVAAKISSAVNSIKQKLQSKWGTENLSFTAALLERIRARIDSIKTALSPAANKCKEIFSKIGQGFKAFAEGVKNSGILEFLSEAWTKIKSFFKGVGTIISGLWQTLVKSLGTPEFISKADIFNAAWWSGMLAIAIKFVKSITGAAKSAQGFLDGITGIGQSASKVLDSVRGSFESYQKNLNADTLKKIAVSVAILTASVLVLSLIDSEKLAGATVAVTALIWGLVGAMKILNHSSGRSMKASKTTCKALTVIGDTVKDKVEGVIDSNTLIKQLIAFSAAILILATALKKVGSLPIDNIKAAGIAIGALALTLAVSMQLLNASGNASGMHSFMAFGGEAANMSNSAKQLLAFAVAVLAMAKAVQWLGSMDVEALQQGIAGVVAICVTTALTLKYLETNVGSMKEGLMMVISAIALGKMLKVMCKTMHYFTTLRLDQMAIALVSMGVCMALLVAAMYAMKNLSGTQALKKNISMSVLLQSFANAMLTLSKISWQGLIKSLIMLTVGLGEIVAVMAIMDNIGGTGAVALMVASAALLVLAAAIKILSTLSWKEVLISLTTLTAIFVLLGVSAALLSPIAPLVVALAAALLMTSFAVMNLGTGLIKIGIGLVSLSVGILAMSKVGETAATAFVNIISTIVSGVLGLFPIICTAIANGIVAIGEVLMAKIDVIGNIIQTIILKWLEIIANCAPQIITVVLTLITTLLDALVENMPTIVADIFEILIALLEGIAEYIPQLVVSAVKIVQAFFQGIADALDSLDLSVIFKAFTGVGLLTALMASLNAAALLTPGALIGAIGMAVVVGELATLIAAIGLLGQLPGLNWLIEEGAYTLELIGEAIGGFIGGIAGKLLGGISDSLPIFGANLSKFAIAIRPFIVQMSMIPTNFLDCVTALSEAILILTATDIINGVLQWLTGEDSFESFADTLVPIGKAIKAFGEEVEGIDGATVANAAAAGESLAKMAAAIPKTGGLFEFISGEHDLGTFADRLSTFGKAIKGFSDEVKGIKQDVIDNSITAGEALIELSDKLPITDGVVKFFTGTQNLGTFGERLVSFGEAMTTYSDKVKDLKTDVVEKSANAGKTLVELANSLEKTGGLSQLITGTSDIGTFGEQLKSFGEAMVSFSNKLENADLDQISEAITAFSDLLALAKSAKDVNSSGMKTFASDLASLGSAGFNGFIDAYEGSKDKVVETANTLVTNFVNAAKDREADLAKAGEDAVGEFSGAVRISSDKAQNSFRQIIADSLIAIRDKYRNFKETGKYLVRGFCAGIDNEVELVKSGAVKMADEAVIGLTDELCINSPSKITEKIGEFFGEGFTNGIGDYSELSFDSGTLLGGSAEDGLREALSNMGIDISSAIDTEPTIKPVVDLSDVQSGATKMRELMSKNTSKHVMLTSLEIDEANRGTTVTEKAAANNTYNFTQNNYSPKALSRIDIYRQTKNQFSAMKGLAGA